MRWISLLLVAGLAAATVGLFIWGRQMETPLPGTEEVYVTVLPGDTPRAVARKLVEQGVLTEPWSFYVWARAQYKNQTIKTGDYKIVPGDSVKTILAKMQRGEVVLFNITVPEGWTFKQFRQALDASPHIAHHTTNMTDDQIMEELGLPGVHPEGMFYPSTYKASGGQSDLDILRRAHQSLENVLEQAWLDRELGHPLSTAYEMLILASIVEKETGAPDERPEIAAVFLNRLRKGMRLQTDPTVIYGMGEAFDGNIRRADLQTDTPYNTYTRGGLPPSPIALPGAEALRAVARPNRSSALFFVANGNGRHIFSETLAAHNKAVDQFQR